MRLLQLSSLIILVASPSAASDSPHGALSIPCADCHDATSWNMRADPAFDHDDVGYTLDGAHAALDCASCHASPEFAHVGVACADCHVDVHEQDLGVACEGCHETTSWNPDTDVIREHTEAGFPLVGAHVRAECEACHADEDPSQFGQAPVTCDGCHALDYTRARRPNHMSVDFGTDCEDCHAPTDASWGVAVASHPAAFPLRAAHATSDCVECHADPAPNAAEDCAGCHALDYVAAIPDHPKVDFDQDCAKCHSTERRDWDVPAFIHTASFPLIGGHRGADCGGCHTHENGSPEMECATCHHEEFVESTLDHVQFHFHEYCQVCHPLAQASWEPSTFPHPSAFPLLGVHAETWCHDCHEPGTEEISPACVDCHLEEFENQPDHIEMGFPVNCVLCHWWTGWGDDHRSGAR